MRMVVEVDLSGVVVSGRSDPVMRRAMRAAEDAVTRASLQAVHDRLGHVLQHPTGFYESRVVADYARRPPSVHDSRVVYGPWLEGVGSRNQTTRFKGYRTFRVVAQQMQSDVVRVTAPVFDRAVRELNR